MLILVINGPNMNMLGIREKGLYGDQSLEDIYGEIETCAKNLGISVEFFQSNSEGCIIDAIQGAYNRCDGIIINPAGYCYSSVGILDAIKAVSIPAVEVHMTNIFAREGFRRNSITASGCAGLVTGFGSKGYCMALNYLSEVLSCRG